MSRAQFAAGRDAGFFSAVVRAAAALLLALLLLAPAHAARPLVMVFGDSLSAAYGLQENEGWVSLLRQRLAKHTKPYDLVNASISGETTRGGASRIGAALARNKPALVVVELGGNDGLRGLSLQDTRANLEAIVKAVKAARAKALIVGIELPPNYGPAYTQRFAAMFAQVAAAQKVPLAPSLLAGFGQRRDLFQADGIHPVAAAQPMMLEAVWKELKPLL